MPAATFIEIDFLPTSYRASVEQRRRTTIYIVALAAILLLGLSGIVHQILVYRELVRTRNSLRVGLPVLEKACQEERVLKARLDQSLRKANQIAILKGGVPVGWITFTVIQSVPQQIRINKLMIELQETQVKSEHLMTTASTQPSSEDGNNEDSQLNEILRRVDTAILRLTISGESLGLTSIVGFLQNLQGSEIFNQVDLETIDETVVENQVRLVRFTICAQLPYQRWRLSAKQADASSSNQSGRGSSSTRIVDGSSIKLETQP